MTRGSEFEESSPEFEDYTSEFEEYSPEFEDYTRSTRDKDVSKPLRLRNVFLLSVSECRLVQV